jgi:hypothetical protein
MPSWGEIKEYARSKYTLQDDDEDAFSLVFDEGEGRSQMISVHHFTAFEKDWIEFRSYVCKEADLNLRVALRKNADFAVGALALDDEGDYYLTYAAPLDTMDPDEFELPLNVIASTADEIEKEHAASDEH